MTHPYAGNGEHTGSYYAASANAVTPRPVLQGEVETDVCVIGGGFTGIETATEMPARLQIFGHLGTDRFQATPSDPNELHKANPDAFMGGCNRYVFKRGMLLLLLALRLPVVREPVAACAR